MTCAISEKQTNIRFRIKIKKKKLLYTAMHLYMDQGRGGSPNLINPNPTTVCVLLYQKNCY